MRDRFGREIDYMRLSITDRCNLRCRYCMPNGVQSVPHADILTYEEFMRIAAAAVQLGITNFKVTGGEPLVRRGCMDFLRRLKALDGVRSVTLTTNGVLLAPLVPQLAQMGIDGVNISLDAADPAQFCAITGADVFPAVQAGIDACCAAGLHTKLNCVLLADCAARLVPLARYARSRALDVRFIERMPIGQGAAADGVTRAQALEILRAEWPDLHPVRETRGNGPAHYYASAALQGRIGMIDALSHKFCADCNRVRVTATGRLKPCLCYGESADLRRVLRTQPQLLGQTLHDAVYAKPRAHCFETRTAITEQDSMNQIGG